MTGYLTDYSGRRYELPVLLSWCVTHGSGTPCDSYEAVCRYDRSMEPLMKSAYRFTGVHNGETVFYGVVDEIEASVTGDGMLFSVSGRGMAALLLDNEAESAEYWRCTLGDILNDYVYPWGVSVAKRDAMGYLYNFTVDSGESAWAVLSRFCAFAGSVSPRFTRDGRLLVTGGAGNTYTLDSSKGAFEFVRREKRYGVISSVLVKNKVQGTRTVVGNSEFIARGGSCRRVVNVPRYTGYSGMRYTGSYQIERSREGSSQFIVTLPELFAAQPADLIRVNLPEVGLTETMMVSEVTVWADGNGGGTEIVMTER